MLLTFYTFINNNFSQSVWQVWKAESARYQPHASFIHFHLPYFHSE